MVQAATYLCLAGLQHYVIALFLHFLMMCVSHRSVLMVTRMQIGGRFV